MADVAGFKFQGKVAGVALVRQGLQAGREVRLAVADAEVDVSGDGVAQVDVGDAAVETLHEVFRAAPGGDDVAEIHDHLHVRAGEAVGQLVRAFRVAAEAEEVQGFGPESDAGIRRALAGCGEFGGDEVEVLVQGADRVVVQRAARQYQRIRRGLPREGEQHLQVPGPLGAVPGGERAVQVADVAVDGAHAQPGAGDGPCDGGDRLLVEDVGHVIAHARQGAEVDLGEAEAGDGGQRRGQVLVPEADGGAAQPRVEGHEVP